MKKKLSLIFILMISLTLFGRWIEIDDQIGTDLFECEQKTRSGSETIFRLDGFDMFEKEYGGTEYIVIRHKDAGELLDIGLPDLPVFTKALIIPEQGTPNLEILSYKKREFQNVVIYPQEKLQVESNPEVDNFVIDNKFYSGKGKYPQNAAWTGEPAIMRDFRIVPVTFCPFQYDAGNKTLTVYTEIRVSVNAEGRDGVNAKYTDRKLSRAFENIYRTNTLNYDQLSLREEYQVPTILFICNDNDDVLENLSYLTEWKRQKGYNVFVATTSETGTNSTAIKSYIEEAYYNWENPPEYVNIIGDGAGTYTIPTWYTSGSYGEGDHPYSQLEGNDVLGDVILGRMTFSSIPELENVINKALIYEKTPYTGNTAWYNRALLTGDPNSSEYSTITVCKATKELMLDYPGNFWSDDNFVEVYSSPFPSQMNAAIDLGVAFYTYRGYLNMSGWVDGNTNNGYKMPFAVIPTCSSNNWQSETGIAEGFYLQGSTSLPGGGIGAMGTATSGTHTPFNNAITLGVWGGIFRDHIYTMGGAVLQGKYYLWLTFPQNPNNYVNTFSHWNTLMGDASLELWTRVPQNLTVLYDEIIPSGTNYYQAVVLDSIGNAASGAWVTLKEDNGEFICTEFCDNSGSVILDITGAQDGDYTLTVTKHNHIPLNETISIEQVDQNIEINSVEYDDSSGNGNGNVNPGETIELMLTLENSGTSNVTGISGSIESTSDQLTVTSSEVTFGDIAAGETGTSTTGFELVLDNAIQGGVEIKLNLVLTDDDDNQWRTWIFVPIEAPCLYASDYSIGGNGIIDPGETEEIYFTLENIGDLEATDVEGTLLCSSRKITIVDSIGNFGSIQAGSSSSNSTNRYTITASSAILPGTQIPFTIQLTSSEGYDSFTTINVAFGHQGTDDPYGPDEYGYWCFDDGDTEYEECPQYDWVEIDPDHGGNGGNTFIWTIGSNMGTGGDEGTYSNIELPEDFSLVYYGIEYESLCVSTNGWIAPGYHETGCFMNYQIPGPQGPSPMIAVFWDDLSLSGGNAFWYYDDEEHFLVVEWSRIQNGDTNSPETFEVIIYDPVYYPTSTGDSKIKMQYMTFNNNNSGSYPSNHGQFCTIGIENHDSSMGLQYTFNNTYPEPCNTIVNQTAILFTPPPIPPDSPFLSVSSFNALSGDDFYIEAGETASISLTLENLGAETAHNIEVELSVNDPYITVLDNSTTYSEIDQGELATLENAFTIEISENVPDFYIFHLNVAVDCDEDSWNWSLPFTAYWANTFAVNQDSMYYEMTLMQTGSQEFSLTNIGDLPVNFYIRTDETTDSGRDISGSMITIDTDSFTPGEETTWTFTVYNGSTDNEWLTDVWIDFPLGVNVTGAGNVIGGSGGEMIWDGITGSGQRINWHGETVNEWGVVHHGETASWEVDVILSTEFAGDMTLGWEIGGDGFFGEPHLVSGELTLLYPLRWINLDTSSGSLEPDESQTITVNYDSYDIPEGIHTGNIVVSSDSWDTKIIHVTLNVTAINEDPPLIPSKFMLTGNYPNPFNPETTISFQIPEEMKVNLLIYNSKGQFVRQLTDDYYKPGSHSIVWDGKDKSGKPVSSGIYFSTLKTDTEVQSRKMVLIK